MNLTIGRLYRVEKTLAARQGGATLRILYPDRYITYMGTNGKRHAFRYINDIIWVSEDDLNKLRRC